MIESSEGAASRPKDGGRARIDRWLDSDLVGIPATLYTFAVLAISLAVFRFGGPIAGIVVAVALWIPMVLFAIQGRGKEAAPLQVRAVREGARHRVLIVANRGLEEPALYHELRRRAAHRVTEAMIVAPVVASSPLQQLADDIDPELAAAQRRVEDAVRRLADEGVSARGRADLADPMESVLDGLHEFPPNEVIVLPDGEAGWEKADDLLERVRAEAGLPVTGVEPRLSDSYARRQS
jgi:hypothetical protein